MKNISRYLSVAAALTVLPPVFAQPSPEANKNPTETRKEPHTRRLDREPVEKESVTFLGVETASVSPTLVAQLGLPDGAGLVVLKVVPDTAAAGALKEHDVLLRLDDQILIDQHQLSVLVRNHKEGDEVTLTFMRGGKQQSAKVKLTKHEVPKMGDMMWRFNLPGMPGGGMGLESGPGEDRQEVNRVLQMMRRSHNGEPVRMHIDREGGPAMRAVRINAGNSNLVYNDELGSLELTNKSGEKSLVAKDAKGNQLFSGPVTTPEQRKAMPRDVRERLERLEAMQNVTFETDDDFEGAETKVLRVPGEKIQFERRAPEPRPHLREL